MPNGPRSVYPLQEHIHESSLNFEVEVDLTITRKIILEYARIKGKLPNGFDSHHIPKWVTYKLVKGQSSRREYAKKRVQKVSKMPYRILLNHEASKKKLRPNDLLLVVTCGRSGLTVSGMNYDGAVVEKKQ
jgi:hypothetical protein